MKATKTILASLIGLTFGATGVVNAQYAPGYGPGTPPPWVWQGNPGQQGQPSMPPMGGMRGPMHPMMNGAQGPMGPMGGADAPMTPPWASDGGGMPPCHAKGPMHGPMGMGAPEGMPDMDAMHAEHMARMKEMMQITPEQDARWQEFESRMNAHHEAMKAFMDSAQEEASKTENPFTVRAKVWDFMQQQRESMMQERQALIDDLLADHAKRMEEMKSHAMPMDTDAAAAPAPAPAPAPAEAAVPATPPEAPAAPAEPAPAS